MHIGLLRAYGTRHGAGPFPTETNALTVAPCHNAANLWQGDFRTGWFDSVTARYALEVVGGVDLLCLTNLDRLIGLNGLKAAVAYQQDDYFPNGRIAPHSPNQMDQEASRQRTNAMLHARPEYQPIQPIRNACPNEFFRYADAIAELIGHDIDLLSAQPDHHKLYRSIN